MNFEFFLIKMKVTHTGDASIQASRIQLALVGPAGGKRAVEIKLNVFNKTPNSQRTTHKR